LGFSIDPVKKEEKALSVQPKVKKNKT